MDFNPNITKNFLDLSVDSRISGEEKNAECTDTLAKQKVNEWQKEGSFVVANAGAYDGLGLNHLRGLTQARLIGAAYKIGSLNDLSAVYDLASSDEIRLIVSLDTNEAIRENKSFRSESGGSIRPLFDWETRARMLALQSIRSSTYLVDYITKHGPGACEVCDNDSCSHSNVTYNVASSGADLTIVKSLKQVTIDTYKNSKFHIIDENDGAFFDKVLGAQISTTALVKRVKKDRSDLL